MKYRFSIVIPVYNSEKYLRTCIESVMSQTYNNFEVILIDDGSTDSSGIICNEFAKKYAEKIKCVHKKNEGLLMTRLRGYEEAEGEYILNLDSDDEFRPDALAILDGCIEETRSDLILFQASVDEKHTIIWENSRLELSSGEILDPSVLKRLVCEGPSVNNIALKCVQKSLFTDIQSLSVYSGMNNEEDLIQSVQLIDKCKRPIYIEEMLYFYRQTNSFSISNSFNPNILESISNSSTVLEKYAKEWEKHCPYLLEKVYERQNKSFASLIRYYFERAEKKEQIEDFLHSLHDDKLFEKAYKKGTRKKLSKIEKLNLFFVYQGKIGFVFHVMRLRAALKRKSYRYIR